MTVYRTIFLFILFLVLAYMKSYMKKEKKTLYRLFSALYTLLLIHVGVLVIISILANKIGDMVMYLDYATYISTAFLPVVLLLIAIKFDNESAELENKRWLFAVPIVTVLMVFTNDFHHLFYKNYSIDLSKTVTGMYAYIHFVYTYVVLAVAIVKLIVASIKKSDFLSIQTLLIILGSMVPIITNVLGTFGIIQMSIYITPITYVFTAICLYISIVKLKALNIIPLSLKTIVDNMSDGFVVLSEDGTIADLNKTFVDKFIDFREIKDKDNLFEILKNSDLIDLKTLKADIKEARESKDVITKEYHVKRDNYERYFEVDFQPIKSKDGSAYVATLILLRDITTLKKDTEMMMKNESLVMLGELAGGVAHDINTPISAIKSGLLILKDTVTTEDEKMLVERMDSCATKIVTLTNSLRNQIRNIGSDEISDVNVTTVVMDMATIIHNDLTKHKVKLNLDLKEEIIVKGNAAKLSQVVTNIVVNAIQAYEGRGGEINLRAFNTETNTIIEVQDFAGGIPKHIRENIGKNILTTKGVSGTGFGLYLAYSVIKGAFGGEIHFDTEEGKGTTFCIIIPKA